MNVGAMGPAAQAATVTGPAAKNDHDADDKQGGAGGVGPAAFATISPQARALSAQVAKVDSDGDVR